MTVREWHLAPTPRNSNALCCGAPRRQNRCGSAGPGCFWRPVAAAPARARGRGRAPKPRVGRWPAGVAPSRQRRGRGSAAIRYRAAGGCRIAGGPPRRPPCPVPAEQIPTGQPVGARLRGRRCRAEARSGGPMGGSAGWVGIPVSAKVVRGSNPAARTGRTSASQGPVPGRRVAQSASARSQGHPVAAGGRSARGRDRAPAGSERTAAPHRRCTESAARGRAGRPRVGVLPLAGRLRWAQGMLGGACWVPVVASGVLVRPSQGRRGSQGGFSCQGSAQ